MNMYLNTKLQSLFQINSCKIIIYILKLNIYVYELKDTVLFNNMRS